MAGNRPESNSRSIRFLITANRSGLVHMPRILALDGGGVRGLSSLLIVQRLMHEIHRIMIENGQTTQATFALSAL